MIARADVTSSRGTMPNSLGALHAARPIGQPFGRSACGLLASLLAPEGSRCTTQWTHGSRAARLSDASKAAACIEDIKKASCETVRGNTFTSANCTSVCT